MITMIEGRTSTTGGCYCRGCGYDLRASAERCPECGRIFDPAVPRSFCRLPRSQRLRRWIRGVFLLLLLVALPPALGLGWLAWGWWEEQGHIAALKQANCLVPERSFEPIYPWLPKYLPKRWAFLGHRAEFVVWSDPLLSKTALQHTASLNHLRTLVSYSTAITDEDLIHLRNLTRLEDLSLRGRGITDKGLIHLAALHRMQELRLEDTAVTGPGLRHLSRMAQLQRLSLKGSLIDNEGLPYLAGLKGLEQLHLTDTPITDAGLIHLAALTQLRGLNLAGTKITDDGLRHLAGAGNLKAVGFRDTAITDAGLEHLRTMRSLKEVYAENTAVTPGGVQRLQEAIPAARIFLKRPSPLKDLPPR